MILEEETTTPGSSAVTHDRRRRRWIVPSFAFAVALVTAVALVVVRSSDGDEPAIATEDDDLVSEAEADAAQEAEPESELDPESGISLATATALANRMTALASRDAWLRPFEPTSIWNMPIGSDAEYVDAMLPRTDRHALEHSTLMRTVPSDPAQPIVRSGTWRDRCSGSEDSGRTVDLPDGWTPPEVTDTATPNNPGVFLLDDGRTMYNLGAMARCDPLGPLYGQWPGDENAAITDLYGDGRLGAHGGSNLNQLGGAIRPGELTGDEPIRHALDLLIWSEHMSWGGSKAASYRWPATTSDSYASAETYRGDNPELQMGALLALPADLTTADLDIDTDVGRRLFQALQDYGAYVTDDSAWDATYLGVDAEAIGSFPWGDAERDDMADMVAALHVVSNNGPDTIGGGGTPRVPLLPELEEPAG